MLEPTSPGRPHQTGINQDGEMLTARRRGDARRSAQLTGGV